MTKYLIGILAGALLVIVAVMVLDHPNPAANPPDLDQQVNDVARNLHPTKLNP